LKLFFGESECTTLKGLVTFVSLHLSTEQCWLVCCCRSRYGSIPAIGTAVTATAEAAVDNQQQLFTDTESPVASGVTIVTASSSSSSSSCRQCDDPTSFEAAVSPKPSLALRHLIRTSAPPSHVTVRTASWSSRPARLVHLATIPASVATGDASCRVAGPPSSSSSTASVQQGSTRASSAQRFRNMVLECRDGD